MLKGARDDSFQHIVLHAFRHNTPSRLTNLYKTLRILNRLFTLKSRYM